MKKKITPGLVVLFALLLLVMSLSKTTSEKMRGATVALLAPCWDCMHSIKLATKTILFPTPGTSASKEEELQRYRIESERLRAELKQLKERMGDHLSLAFDIDAPIIPARVIFRSASTWDSSLWVNVGKVTNASLGRELVAKNSPVVLGQSVVGVIDYVGEKQSRVKLITDTGLVPSVRALRTQGKTSYPLAKGELQGCCKPHWRKDKYVLRGTGFNYDFADQEGPARDLRTGKPLDASTKHALPLIKVGDLLVTTGLDGVFPPGLQVARVTKIFPLKEGDYYYELEAQPTVKDLDDLTVLFILQPVGFDPQDQPPL